MLLDFGDLSLLVLRSDVLMSWIFGHDSLAVSLDIQMQVHVLALRMLLRNFLGFSDSLCHGL